MDVYHKIRKPSSGLLVSPHFEEARLLQADWIWCRIGTNTAPREALRGGIPTSFLEPSCRSLSHFVGIYRQKMTRSLQIDF